MILISIDMSGLTAFLVLSCFLRPECSGYWNVRRGRQFLPISSLCFSQIHRLSSWSEEKSCGNPDLLRISSYSWTILQVFLRNYALSAIKLSSGFTSSKTTVAIEMGWWFLRHLSLLPSYFDFSYQTCIACCLILGQIQLLTDVSKGYLVWNVAMVSNSGSLTIKLKVVLNYPKEILSIYLSCYGIQPFKGLENNWSWK